VRLWSAFDIDNLAKSPFSMSPFQGDNSLDSMFDTDDDNGDSCASTTDNFNVFYHR
jgi:hypothetical protein